jgi:hypothetical protein
MAKATRSLSPHIPVIYSATDRSGGAIAQLIQELVLCGPGAEALCS